MTWCGYLVCGEDGLVVPFEAAHKSKRAAIEAAERYAFEERGAIPTESYAWDSASHPGELYQEAAVEAARDGVTGCYGLETGFELLDVVHLEPRDSATCLSQARGNGIREADLRGLLAAYMTVEETVEESDVEHDFLALVERMGAYYN